MGRSTKHPKVVEKKLGREKAYGQAHDNKNLIEIDPRQKARRHLRTLVHEKMHKMYPDWSENKVDNESKHIAFFLWEQGYRKVILK